MGKEEYLYNGEKKMGTKCVAFRSVETIKAGVQVPKDNLLSGSNDNEDLIPIDDGNMPFWFNCNQDTINGFIDAKLERLKRRINKIWFFIEKMDFYMDLKIKIKISEKSYKEKPTVDEVKKITWQMKQGNRLVAYKELAKLIKSHENNLKRRI